MIKRKKNMLLIKEDDNQSEQELQMELLGFVIISLASFILI